MLGLRSGVASINPSFQKPPKPRNTTRQFSERSTQAPTALICVLADLTRARRMPAGAGHHGTLRPKISPKHLIWTLQWRFLARILQAASPCSSAGPPVTPPLQLFLRPTSPSPAHSRPGDGAAAVNLGLPVAACGRAEKKKIIRGALFFCHGWLAARRHLIVYPHLWFALRGIRPMLPLWSFPREDSCSELLGTKGCVRRQNATRASNRPVSSQPRRTSPSSTAKGRESQILQARADQLPSPLRSARLPAQARKRSTPPPQQRRNTNLLLICRPSCCLTPPGHTGAALGGQAVLDDCHCPRLLGVPKRLSRAEGTGRCVASSTLRIPTVQSPRYQIYMVRTPSFRPLPPDYCQWLHRALLIDALTTAQELSTTCILRHHPFILWQASPGSRRRSASFTLKPEYLSAVRVDCILSLVKTTDLQCQAGPHHIPLSCNSTGPLPCHLSTEHSKKKQKSHHGHSLQAEIQSLSLPRLGYPPSTAGGFVFWRILLRPPAVPPAKAIQSVLTRIMPMSKWRRLLPIFCKKWM